MSSWFQRTPDLPRKKGLHRELSLEKQKPRSHPPLSPSLSAKNSPTTESPKTPTGHSSGILGLSGLGKHKPVNATKSSPIGNSPSTPPKNSPPSLSSNSPERNEEENCKTDSMTANMEELLKEIQKLKENEASIAKKLAMERQQRIMAEQRVQAERMALHEVQYRHYVMEKSHKGHKGGEKWRSAGAEEDLESNVDGSVTAEASCFTTENAIDLRESEEQEKSTYSMESLFPMNAEFNFSTSIFGQLTNDLQKILSVGKEEEPQSRSVFSRALDAVKSGNSSELRDTVPDLRREDGLPLLKLASEKGHGSCLRVLLTAGSFASDSSSANGVTPLHVAALHGQNKAVEVLLEHNAPLAATDSEGHTPLFLALRQSHSKAAGLLIKAGSPLDTISHSGQTLLHVAVMGHLPGALHSILVRLRVHSDGRSKMRDLITHKDEDFRTALHVAASRGLKSCAEVLCATGEVDLTQRDRWNSTPIDIATGDTKDILLNKESKSIILYIQVTPSSISPTITHNTSYDLTEMEELEDEGEENMFSLAIGNVNLLRHHTFSDLEQIVKFNLRSFCSYINLSNSQPSIGSSSQYSPSKLEDNGNNGLLEVASKKFQQAKCFLPSSPEEEEARDQNRNSNSDSGYSDNAQDGKSERTAYTHECRNLLRKFSSKLPEMEFIDDSIYSYRVGHYTWKAGMLPNSLHSKNLFNLFKELLTSGNTKGSGIYVKLKDASENRLDQLSLELMMPMSQLKDCIQVLEGEKKLLLHGPHGNGKAHLARSLAHYLQCVHGVKQTQLINVYMDESFDKNDLFRLFYSNNLLLPAMSEGVTSKKPASSGPFKRHILLLNHMSSATHPGLLSQIIALVESREAELSLWVNEVPCRHDEGKSKPDVPGGLYYLKEKCYFIGTWTSADRNSALPPAIVDHFPHISMDMSSALSCGVLRRQLLSASVHCANGMWPHLTQPLYRLVQWVGDIWTLYNQLMANLGLSYAPTGLKHFLSCPVSSLSPEKDIPHWLINVWKFHIVPSILCVLQDYFNQDMSNSMSYQVLSAIVGLAVLPTCPLSCNKKDEIVQALCRHIEECCSSTNRPPAGPSVRGSGLVGELPTNSSPVFHSYHSSPSSLKKLSPLLGQRRGSLQSLNSPTLARKGILQRGTPLINQRRGSWTDLRSTPHVTFEKPGKLVSYEDMVKNSPRVKDKFKKIKEETDSAPATPTTPTTTTISISPPEDTSEAEKDSSPPLGTPEESDKEIMDKEPKSPTKERVGNKLRKIRSKTISLFSRDGTGTLPRLFRRGSRPPLTSVTEEGHKSSILPASSRYTSIPTPSLFVSDNKPEFTQSLDESNLSGTFKNRPSSLHYKSRRTPPPPPLPIQNGTMDVIKETRDTAEALQDLDEFLDLLSSTPADRIDKQRGSLPEELRSSSNEEALSDDGTNGNPTVPKYYLPTVSSPWQQKPQESGQGRLAMSNFGSIASPPAFSMPNLSGDSVEEGREYQQQRNYLKVSPAYASSHQFAASDRHTSSTSGDRMSHNQRPRDLREVGAERDATMAENQSYKQRMYSNSTGYDVPSRHHQSFRSECTYNSNPHSYQHHHQHSVPRCSKRAMSTSGRARQQEQQLEQEDEPDDRGTWCEANGSVPSQDDGFLSPTKRWVDGDVRSPSPLTMASYSSNENRSSSSKYYTYHIGHHNKRTPVLPENYHPSGKNGQDSTRMASPHFGNATKETSDVYDGDREFEKGSKSPMGRLDTWSNRHSFGKERDEWSSKERSKSLSYGQSHLQRNKVIPSNTAIPPPIDVLKKRTSVTNAFHDDQLGSGRRRHSSSGSMHDMRSDSMGDLSSPKALDSGALFGASLGFLGSSGSLNDIHAKM